MYNRLINNYQDYYQNHFPFDLLVNWLRYNDQYDFTRREWSYEAIGETGDDPFVKRFVQVENGKSLRAIAENYDVLKLKFDVGAFYDFNMAARVNHPITPQQREFVFDIDATDYESVRRCCQGKQMCTRCWRFMETAACVIVLFCQVFGFERYFFVFSGRRGLHCWICDADARALRKPMRLEMLKLFNIVDDSVSKINIELKKDQVSTKILEFCKVFYEQMVFEQNWYEESFIVNILRKLDAGSGKGMKLNELITQLKDQPPVKIKQLIDKHKIFEQIVVYLVYPRFDAEVTTSMNHLLKVPFSIHSATLNVSTPISHQHIIDYYDIKLRVQQQPGLDYRFDVEKPIKIDQDDRIKQVVGYFKNVCENVLLQ